MRYEDLMTAIDRCAQLNIPFAAYAYPGSNDYGFMSSYPNADTGENYIAKHDAETGLFEIDMFNHENCYSIGIKEVNSVDSINALPRDMKSLEAADITPLKRSTTEILHSAQVHEIKKRLRSHKIAKVVLSRLIYGETTGVKVSQVAKEYFEKLPDTFRFIYFTQETGLWIGASPELLIDYDNNTHRMTVMSLAGTRPVSDEEWDNKNEREHDFVTAHILLRLEDIGATDVMFDDTYNLRFGDIEHICDILTFRYDGDPHEVISLLSPTPAVGGSPTELAVEAIYDYEVHQRHCYAGNIIVNDPRSGSFRAYVNLRSALLQPQNDKDNTILYNIYAGGGIISKSKAQDEWLETSAKAAPFTSIIEKYGSIK